MKNRAVFLDRDGTIIRDTGYLSSPGQIEILAGAKKAIKFLNQRGLTVVIISNQSGIARGYFTEEDLGRIHQKLKDELAKNDAFIDAIYYCPHHAEVGNEIYKKECNCRKPNPGLLTKAALDLNIDLNKSYMVGDKFSDIEAGNRAGCKTILVLTGEGKVTIREIGKGMVAPNFVAQDLGEAVKWILVEQGAS